MKKYRCNKCFECPSCQHTLSARATTVQISKPESGGAEGDVKPDPDSAASAEAEKSAKLTTRKMYYLSCLACRWTSRDVGLPDQTNGQLHNCDYFMMLFNLNHIFCSDRQLARE